VKSSSSISKAFAEIAVILIIYIVILIVSGIYKSNILLNELPRDIIESARISSYVSLTISSIISAIFIGLIIGFLFFSNILFGININEYDIISSFDNTILVLIFFELVRFLFALLELEKQISYISFSENFLEEVKLTEWYFYDTSFKYVMIFISPIIFAVTLKKRTKDVGNFNLVFLSVLVLLGFYLSSIDLFETL
jgi:hypothetical protein